MCTHTYTAILVGAVLGYCLAWEDEPSLPAFVILRWFVAVLLTGLYLVSIALAFDSLISWLAVKCGDAQRSSVERMIWRMAGTRLPSARGLSQLLNGYCSSMERRIEGIGQPRFSVVAGFFMYLHVIVGQDDLVKTLQAW
jgi:hypothetical protein